MIMRFLPVVLALSVMLVASPVAAHGQEVEEVESAAENGTEEGAVHQSLRYEREVFRYQRAGRRDPFRSLLGTADLAVRAEDLVLRGVIVNPDPRQSVAVIREARGDRQFRVRPGDRIGGIRVVAIQPDRVDLVVEELGVARSHTLRIRRDQ
jgi:type II secretory pathway component PulC